MDRIEFAGNIISKLDGISNLLDVGCRDCSLQKYLAGSVEYYGVDLFQNASNTVAYVGDITMINISKKFDAVVALDILEHVENPATLFNKLLSLTNKHLIISLPNTYDLKSRVNFCFNAKLGGKYKFESIPSMDRHRWLMNRAEIHAFFKAKALEHNLQYVAFDMLYGDPHSESFITRIRSLSRIMPRNLSTSTVFGVFSVNIGKRAQ